MVNTATEIARNKQLFEQCHIRPEWRDRAMEVAKRLCSTPNKLVFQRESSKTGVPWYIIAVIKEREAGADSAWKLSIAQGDAWDKPSRHVPKGRGPFPDWYAAADDALNLCAPYASHWRDWSVGGGLTLLERYNGLGYFERGVVSPYLFSGTTVYARGKYGSDDRYDPDLVDKQVGCAAILMCMAELDSSVQFMAPGTPARSGPPPKEVVDDKTKTSRRIRTAGTAVGTATGAGKAGTSVQDKPVTSPTTDMVLWGGIVLGVALFVGAAIAIVSQKSKLLNEWF